MGQKVGLSVEGEVSKSTEDEVGQLVIHEVGQKVGQWRVRVALQHTCV